MTDGKNKLKEDGEQTLIEAVLDVSSKLVILEQRMSAVPEERHTEEHEYIKLEIESKKARRDFYRGVSEKPATTTIIGAFGLLLTALGYGFTQWVIGLKP